jgi:hypothetical protein
MVGRDETLMTDRLETGWSESINEGLRMAGFGFG